MAGKYKHLWDRSKDGSNEEARSFLRYAVIATLVFVAFLFVKKGNIVRWVQAGFTIGRQKHQMELYEKRIQQLDKEITMLSTDRDSLEYFAREKFHFAEPGDDVYIEEQ